MNDALVENIKRFLLGLADVFRTFFKLFTEKETTTENT